MRTFGVTPRTNKGFTLVELIIGIVVLSLSVVMLAVLIFPQAQRSAEPLLQTRAAGLGQALLNEIMSKSFDENSDRSSGIERCSVEAAAPPCTPPANLRDDGEVRSDFNDVDDYHGLTSSSTNLTDVFGADIAARYNGFDYEIQVSYYDLNSGAEQANITRYKLITITITTSLGQNFEFSAVRGNF